MSYFDDASLVMIPSGYKTSKVYSVKPTDGTGDLTFTRSNDTATRVGPDGLIEKVRTNLALYSEDFANAAWVKSNLTVTSNSVANPLNGAVTADTLTGNGSSGLHGVQQVTTAFGANHTISVYAKKGTNDFIQIYTDFVNSDYANFDLNTGVVGDKGATTGAATMTSVGDGWYRCSIVTGSALSGNINVCLVTANNAARAETNTLSTTAYAFGAQLETGDIATLYIPTTTAAVSVGPVANVPRLDYLGGGCPKLLLEPQRVNLVTFSEQINNAAWTKQAGATITANSVISPDGTQNADTLNVTTSAYSSVYNTTPYSASSGVYTQSIYAKKGTKNWLYILDLGASSAKAWFNLDTGVVGTVASGYTATIQNAGNGWYRCILTETTNRLPLYFHFGASDADNSFTPSSAGTAFIWGCQVEQGAFATSYIPTLAAAVTRSADAASKTGISALIGQTEGTLFVEMTKDFFESPERFIAVSDGTTSNRIMVNSAAGGGIRGFITSAGITQFDFTSVISSIGTHKIALAYANNDVTLYIDGVQVTTDNSATIPAVANLFIGMSEAGATASLNGRVNQALLFKTRLTNAQLAELTTI